MEKLSRGVAKVQRQPSSPKAEEILGSVAREYAISVGQVLDRRHVEAYWLEVYLLRGEGICHWRKELRERG
jgi:hypothetical protein